MSYFKAKMHQIFATVFANFSIFCIFWGGSVAELLACWTQAQNVTEGPGFNSQSQRCLRQTVRTHCASVHQAAKLVAALLRVAGLTADLAESNGSLPPGL